MSVMKYAFAPVQEPVLDQRHWEQLHGERGRRSAAKFASASKKAGTKVILSHVTIMASVAVEPAPYDYLIRPESSHLVNHNGDAWVNEVLRMSYPTFRGAFNFVEHFQSTKASKGWIVDAVLRKVSLGPSPDLYTYYVDLLVATDFKHEDLVAKIRSGEVKYLSMGCLTDLITCSFCGASGDGSEPACFHLTDFGKTRKFRTDQWGVPRRVSELCGHPSLPGGGVRFIEASWVATPAFPGAARRNTVLDEWDLPEDLRVAKAASLDLSYALPKVASLAATDAPQLPTPSCERPASRILAELRRLR